MAQPGQRKQAVCSQRAPRRQHTLQALGPWERREGKLKDIGVVWDQQEDKVSHGLSLQKVSPLFGSRLTWC